MSLPRSLHALLAATLTLLALATFNARADEARPLAEDPVAEKRLIKISEELRCLVCQNESIAGSRADLANDLRREIRILIQEGRSDKEILDFLVARYGDFVRYRPPFKPATVLLWVGPFVLLALGLWVLFRLLRQRVRAPEPTALSAAEQQRAQALLDALGSDPKTPPTP